MTIIDKINSLKDIVKHFLQVDDRTRENDLWLIINVCERLGYCRRFRLHNQKYAYVFYENDILQGKMPRSFMDTVRRTRQKLQQHNPGLRPMGAIQEQRKEAERDMRLNIVEA